MGTEALRIRKAELRDVVAVAALYDELNDYLSKHVNYPGWRRGVYPTHEDAEASAQENALFVEEAERARSYCATGPRRPTRGRTGMSRWTTRRYWCFTPSPCIRPFCAGAWAGR